MARLGVRIGLYQQRKAIAVVGIGDPGLRAIDDVIVAIALGDGADRLQIGATIGLGQRDAPRNSPVANRGR